MPLHLLGKKSWNVYNVANIEKVKRDEAAAAAREAAEEQRMQEEDAERRMKQLRGVEVEPIKGPEEERAKESGRRPDAHDGGRERKRRRVQGEDDTERDIRYAREDRALAERGGDHGARAKTSDAPLTDKDGHISLFPIVPSRQGKAKNPEAAAEEKKKQREFEDQYTMRFSNAAGFKQSAGETPWYHSQDAYKKSEKADTVSKNVWGNEDPRRKEREKKKLAADDPMAAIQRGVQGVRKAERERQAWRAEKERDVADLIREERRESRKRKHKHRHSRHGEGKAHDASSRHVKIDGEDLHRRKDGRGRSNLSDDDSLENFSLDASKPAKDNGSRHRSRRDEPVYSHGHRSPR